MGKGSGSSQAPMMPPADNNDDSMLQMMAMMMEMMGSMGNEMPQQPEPIEAPEVKKVEPVDWEKKQQELQDKMAVDYDEEKRKKVGVEDTTYTSPLLDEETTTEQNSILG